MLLTPTLLAPSLLLALQVGPNQSAVPPTDMHSEMREREPRDEDTQALENPASIWLGECLGLLEEDASRAHTMAQLQRNATTGIERILANHCLGLAATELGLWGDAITAFEAAYGEAPSGEDRLTARYASMAGNAALASNDVPRAVDNLRIAKLHAERSASAPLQSLVAIDLARALVSMGSADEALIELETATSLTPDSAEAWLLTATLQRRLERYEDAQTSIERAGELAPRDPAVGLEAGVIALFAGRDDAARSSWQSVIDLAPGTPAASTAQNYLDQIGPATPSPDEAPS